MKDEEATKDASPILDSRGLMCDVQQLRYIAHTLACDLHGILQAVPGLAFVLGADVYTSLDELCASIHELTCDKEKSDLPLNEEPTWRLFHPTND